MKLCSRCKIQKRISQFSKLTRSPDGHLQYCKDCDNSRQLAWRENNQAAVRITRRRAKLKHRNTLRQDDLMRYWAQNNLHGARSRARITNRPFDLTLNGLMAIMPSVCPLLGIVLNYSATMNDRHISGLRYIRSIPI